MNNILKAIASDPGVSDKFKVAMKSPSVRQTMRLLLLADMTELLLKVEIVQLDGFDDFSLVIDYLIDAKDALEQAIAAASEPDPGEPIHLEEEYMEKHRENRE